jgi:predicted kinase
LRRFNRYLDQRREDISALHSPLDTGRRALHVGFTAAMRWGSPDNTGAGAGEARSYLDLARSLLSRGSPRLIAIGGLSGSGKSTLAAALAPDIGAAPGARVLRSDVERKRLMGVAPEERLPASAYEDSVGLRVYEILIERAASADRAFVVLDAVFARPWAVRREINRARCAVRRIMAGCLSGILRRRIAARARTLPTRQPQCSSGSSPTIWDRSIGAQSPPAGRWRRS